MGVQSAVALGAQLATVSATPLSSTMRPRRMCHQKSGSVNGRVAADTKRSMSRTMATGPM